MAGNDLLGLTLQPEYRSDLHDLVADFYIPCLSRSKSYDRAVGYFTSAGLALAGKGLSPFATHGGQMRLVASPVFSSADILAIENGLQNRDAVLTSTLASQLKVEDLSVSEQENLRLLTDLVARQILDIRIAIPVDSNAIPRLGIYHEKMGVFRDEVGNTVAFSGSANETVGGLVSNFESIDVYWSWDDPHERTHRKADNFQRLWEDQTKGLQVINCPEATRRKLIQLRDSLAQASSKKTRSDDVINVSSNTQRSPLWPHQTDAISTFLDHKEGVLEMATGTGKTRVAIELARYLLTGGQVNQVIVAADGNDLLDQWYDELLDLAYGGQSSLTIYKHYEGRRDSELFVASPEQACMLTSRLFLPLSLRPLSAKQKEKTLLIHDEVHKLGSRANRENLDGLAEGVGYRLGLSATPEREYDDEGTAFIRRHVGSVIFRYDLEDAIREGILSPFDYFPLQYTPSEADRNRVAAVYKKVAARKHEGRPMSKQEIWTDIARVYKTSEEKIPVFSDFIRRHPYVLDRCLVFVETTEYGYKVLSEIHRLRSDFHTYFSGDDDEVLRRFADGRLECLITCHRLSEGIDIQSLKNVILFASARSRLETIQRMGRCLRRDPEDVTKRAAVIDFIRDDLPGAESGEEGADSERQKWLSRLSQVTPEGCK